MTKQQRAETARNNGAKSRGPTTPEGKTRSSKNSVKHGLTACSGLLLPGEDPAALQALLDAYNHRFQPADGVERHLVEQMVTANWRLNRLTSYESALMETQMEAQRPMLEKRHSAIDMRARAARAFKALADVSNSLNLIIRYQAQARRAYDRALKNLRELQADRRSPETAQKQELRNEPSQPSTHAPSMTSDQTQDAMQPCPHTRRQVPRHDPGDRIPAPQPR